jgi:hypothetical protein
LFSALQKEREMSLEINQIYKDTFNQTIKEMNNSLENYSNKEYVLLRPVVLDGDDVTIMAESHLAWEFSIRFVNEFNKLKVEKEFKNNTNLENLIRGMSVGVGIAFCKKHFPFYDAYEIAHSCCSNAKKIGREVSIKDQSISSIDYHVCYSSLLGTVSEYRQKYQTFPNNYLLSRKPLIFGEVEEQNEIRSLNKFNDLLFTINPTKNHEFPKSRIKDLRDYYGLNPNAVKHYYHQFLKNVKPTIQEELPKEAFVEWKSPVENKLYYLGTMFDPIDVIDIIDYIQIKEGE